MILRVWRIVSSAWTAYWLLVIAVNRARALRNARFVRDALRPVEDELRERRSARG